MDIAEDRGRIQRYIERIGIPYPNYGTAYNTDEAIEGSEAGWLSCAHSSE